MEMISVGMWVAGLFGKTPAAKVARRIGIGVTVVGLLLAGSLAIWYGIKMHDAGVVTQYQDRRDAAVANASLEADREAAVNATARADAADALNQNLTDALANATAADPQHGQTSVGPVTDSYYDQMRRERQGRK